MTGNYTQLTDSQSGWLQTARCAGSAGAARPAHADARSLTAARMKSPDAASEARRENFGDAERLSSSTCRRRYSPPKAHDDVIGPMPASSASQPGTSVMWAPDRKRQPRRRASSWITVFEDRLRGMVQAGRRSPHASVAQPRGALILAQIVPSRPGFATTTRIFFLREAEHRGGRTAGTHATEGGAGAPDVVVVRV